MRITSCFLGLLCCVAAVVSCHSSGLAVEEVTRKCSVAHEDGSADSLRVDISLEWPAGGLSQEALTSVRNDIAYEAFGENGSADIETSVSSYIAALTDRYREYDEGFIFSWDEMVDGRFLEPFGHMQSYLLYRYEYTGGAHGIDYDKGLTYNLKDGSRVRESDLFIEGYEPELARILTERLPESAGSDVYEMLFVKTIEPSGNFYVTPSGITYIYGRYEIGPYVIGIVHVEVPWEDLVGILK